MADEENEDLQMAIHMSMQHPSCSLPDPKRSKPRDDAVPRLSSADESPEVKNRRLQRERMAEAAEKRMMMAKSTISAALISKAKEPVGKGGETGLGERAEEVEGGRRAEDGNLGRELTATEAGHLFSMVFGASASRAILAQWTNQGVRFSPDPETSIGLVQHEGGPCGVLAAIQAFVLKYLIFFPEELGRCEPNVPQNLGLSKKSESRSFAWNKFICPSEERKLSALIRSMVEMLFLCGSNRRAVIATLSILSHDTWQLADGTKYEIVGNVLEGLSIESASDLQKILRVSTYTSQAIAFQRVQAMIPIFESRMGALLFLISALLSRGLDSVQGDRDDPNPPLVTAPFGHASQEIVNLLLCGQAVPNVFDGRMDLGGGMFLKGVSTRVEVGFLTLLESLNFCKVGQNLKHPNWPIWVVGSESHYTVLFALDTSAQDENELEKRESRIREAFDAQDQSGGGGFVSVEGLHQVLREMAICLPTEKLDHLSSTGFIVWSEFWQALLDLDESDGGLRDSTGLMGKKVFDLYHFNGIAKSILNGGTSGGETPVQRPRLAQLRVSVPPRWSLEEYMAKPESDSSGKETFEVANPEPVQHAPLVDCIRTRWPRAVCNWVGDPPSIV